MTPPENANAPAGTGDVPTTHEHGDHDTSETRTPVSGCRTLAISLFEHKADNDPRQAPIAWKRLERMFREPTIAPCTPTTCAGKACPHKETALWSPVTYPAGATRANANVAAVSLLVLDLDDLSEDELAEVERKIAPYRRIVGGSHNDRPGARRVRVVIALSRPVPGAEWPRFWPAATARLDLPKLDEKCKDAARPYYLPSVRTGVDYYVSSGDGAALDVDEILAAAPSTEAVAPRPRLAAVPPSVDPADRAEAIKILAENWPAPGARHDARLAVAGALAKDVGWPEDAIRDFVVEIVERVPYTTPEDRARAVADCAPAARDTAARVAAGVDVAGKVAGWGALKKLMPAEVVDAASSALTRSRSAGIDEVVAEVERAESGHCTDPLHEIGMCSCPPTEKLESLPAAKPLEEYGGSLIDYLGDDDPGDSEDAWLVQGVIASGVPQVIAGSPKSRKTFLAEHLAISIAAGVDWLGQFRTKRGRVLILPREDSMRETRRRIWRLARGLGRDPRELDGWLRIDSKTPFYFSSEKDVDRMRRTIEAWEPSLILIDSLSRTHTGDENSVKEMSIVTSTWGDLCQRYDVAVATIHHFTKSGEGSLIQRLRGTGDLGALVRHLVGVEKKDATTSALEFDGNLTPLHEPFLVEFTDTTDANGKACIRIEHQGSANSAERTRLRTEILAAVARAGSHGITKQDLEREVTGKSDRIRAEVGAMLRDGALRQPSGPRGKLFIGGPV